MKEKRRNEKERKILYLEKDSGLVNSLLRVPRQQREVCFGNVLPNI